MEVAGSQAIMVDSTTGVDMAKKYVAGWGERENVLETNNKQRAARLVRTSLDSKRRHHMTSGLFPLLPRLPHLTRSINMSPSPTSAIKACRRRGGPPHLLNFDQRLPSTSIVTTPPLLRSFAVSLELVPFLSMLMASFYFLPRHHVAFSQCCLEPALLSLLFSNRARYPSFSTFACSLCTTTFLPYPCPCSATSLRSARSTPPNVPACVPNCVTPSSSSHAYLLKSLLHTPYPIIPTLQSRPGAALIRFHFVSNPFSGTSRDGVRPVLQCACC